MSQRHAEGGGPRHPRMFPGALAAVVIAVVGVAQAQLTEVPGRPGSPTAPGVSLADARRAMEQGRFDRAEAVLRLLQRENRISSDAAYLLAYALLREGKAREALTAYTEAAALRTPTAEDFRNVGQAYVLLDDDAEAERWLTRSLRMQPDSPDTWYNLGRLRYKQNLFAKAVQCFEKVLTLVPRSVKAENNLGLAYEGLNRSHDAELAYRQAVDWQDAGPQSAASEQPLLNLAILLLHNSDVAEAQVLLLRAVAIAPKDDRIHEQLGQLYLREARYTDAVKEFEVAAHLAPSRSSLHFLLGQAYRRVGRQAEASAEFKEAARLMKAAPDAPK